MEASHRTPDVHSGDVQLHPVLACHSSSIRSIPTEVLMHIFIQAYRNHEGNRHRATLATLTVRKVCKFFRAAADATPELWSYMASHYDLAFVKTALDLSRCHSLTVEFSARDVSFRQFSECILPHLPRCRYLTFDGYLFCRDSGKIWPDLFRFSEPSVTRSLPKLAGIILKSSELTCTSSVLQTIGLTELRLDECFIECDFLSLLQAFGQLPALTTLWLRVRPVNRLRLPRNWDVSHVHTPVPLVSLQKLSLLASFRHIIYATTHLDIQDTCNVSLTAEPWDIHRNSAPIICQWLAAAFSTRLRRMFPDNNPELGPKELRIAFDDKRQPVDMSMELSQSTRDQPERKRCFYLNLMTGYQAEGPDKLLRAFQTIIAWDALRHVKAFRGDNFPYPKRWRLWESATPFRVPKVVPDVPDVPDAPGGSRQYPSPPPPPPPPAALEHDAPSVREVAPRGPC
ncbi:unnamed protein product [Peniophora sp. CBMAI 1063]|nr:unnamed protein product [Peniophora sp. CBMAI 1063]